MNERDMVCDILSCVKASLSTYAKMIVECNDQTLRQTLQQMRDSDEKFQYDLYKIAAEKGYYIPSLETDMLEVNKVKASLGQLVMA